MDDLRYIFAKPIEIKNVGNVYPLTIMEYAKYSKLFGILQITVNLLLQQVDTKNKKERNEIKKNTKNFDVVTNNEQSKNQLLDLLSICLRIDRDKIYCYKDKKITFISLNWNKELFEEYKFLCSDYEKNSEKIKNIATTLFKNIIHRDNYDEVRNTILKINNIRLPKQSSNPELQKIYDKDYKNKCKKSDTDFEDRITAIVASTNYKFNDISEMTIYQLNKLIERINIKEQFHIDSFGGIIASCFGAKDIKITSWLKHSEIDNTEVKTGSSFDELYRTVDHFIHDGNK